MAEAQSREVPLQRVADTVAGKFCYTVMASSAVTFAFWALAGRQHMIAIPHIQACWTHTSLNVALDVTIMSSCTWQNCMDRLYGLM